MQKDLYVAGAVYDIDGTPEFRLVRPTGKDSLPYVSERKYQSLTAHHSHLYRIKTYRTLKLVAHGNWQCDLPAPETVTLTEEQGEEVRKSILSGKRYTL